MRSGFFNKEAEAQKAAKRLARFEAALKKLLESQTEAQALCVLQKLTPDCKLSGLIELQDVLAPGTTTDALRRFAAEHPNVTVANGKGPHMRGALCPKVGAALHDITFSPDISGRDDADLNEEIYSIDSSEVDEDTISIFVDVNKNLDEAKRLLYLVLRCSRFDAADTLINTNGNEYRGLTGSRSEVAEYFCISEDEAQRLMDTARLRNAEWAAKALDTLATEHVEASAVIRTLKHATAFPPPVATIEKALDGLTERGKGVANEVYNHLYTIYRQQQEASAAAVGRALELGDTARASKRARLE